MDPLIYVNGKFYKKSEAVVSVFDHGLLYGDGIFETLRSYRGQILFLSRHLDRLLSSAASISLKIDLTPEQIGQILYQTLEQNRLQDAYIRISVTRGKGEIGLDPALCPKPTLIVMAKTFRGHPKELYQNGIHASLVKVRRNASQSIDPSIKSMNFLNNILAMQEAMKSGAREALMLNPEGWVCEGSVSNIFWVQDEVVKTPDIGCGLLAGITREAVIKTANLSGVLVEEGYFPPEDLLMAKEVFVTNTSYEVMPVTLIDQNRVMSGKVGKITRLLLLEYRKKIPEFLAEG